MHARLRDRNFSRAITRESLAADFVIFSDNEWRYLFKLQSPIRARDVCDFRINRNVSIPRVHVISISAHSRERQQCYSRECNLAAAANIAY
jgi:hypothetical protein